MMNLHFYFRDEAEAEACKEAVKRTKEKLRSGHEYISQEEKLANALNEGIIGLLGEIRAIHEEVRSLKEPVELIKNYIFASATASKKVAAAVQQEENGEGSGRGIKAEDYLAQCAAEKKAAQEEHERAMALLAKKFAIFAEKWSDHEYLSRMPLAYFQKNCSEIFRGQDMATLGLPYRLDDLCTFDASGTFMGFNLQNLTIGG